MTPSSSLGFASIGRLHGRPDLVIPLHVVAGFLESDRGNNDSGVRPVKAIFGIRFVDVVEQIEKQASKSIIR